MDEFVELAEEMIERAEAVECPLEDFHVGLVLLRRKLTQRIESEDVDPEDPDILAQVE